LRRIAAALQHFMIDSAIPINGFVSGTGRLRAAASAPVTPDPTCLRDELTLMPMSAQVTDG
jgi:hypothetical protein